MPQTHGIYTVDTQFHRDHFDAAYLVVESNRAAFIDCGTSHSVPALLAALEERGLRPENVDWLILTHVHLDHAGGAGALLQHLPNARAVIHPRGAPHMVDPGRLIAGATAVYGEEEMARSYGTIVPIPEGRIDIARDGHVVNLAGREMVCIDTPGHAMHHLCVWDARSRSFFTGDTFGISYRELDGPDGIFIFPTTTPVQFDPVALKASIQRLLTYQPETMYITHYGPIKNPALHAGALNELIDAMVELAQANADVDDRHATLTSALAELFVPRAAKISGLPTPDVHELLAMDIELNAQGLGVWLDRQQRRRQQAGTAS